MSKLGGGNNDYADCSINPTQWVITSCFYHFHENPSKLNHKLSNYNQYASISLCKNKYLSSTLVPPSFLHKQTVDKQLGRHSKAAVMKSGQILVLLLGLVVSGLLAHDDGGGGSETRLSFSRWVNLLRYVHKTQQREPVADHVDHFNRTEHVELISTGIRKHFFNDHIRGKLFIFNLSIYLV